MTTTNVNAATWVQQVTARENTNKQKGILMPKPTSRRGRPWWWPRRSLWQALTSPTRSPKHRKTEEVAQ